jgi:hypothetical protein
MKNTEPSVRIAGVSAKFRNGHFQNSSQKLYCLNRPIRPEDVKEDAILFHHKL